MSENRNKKQNKGGGKLFRSAGEASGKKLSECPLNTWRDLRPALEVGAADQNYITAMELLSNEPIKVNLTILNPRTFIEEVLNDVNVRRFMAYELEDLARERDAAMRRENRREAPGQNVNDADDEGTIEFANGVEVDDDDLSDDEDVIDNVVADVDVDVEVDDPLLNQDVYDSQKVLIINRYNEESKLLRKENQKLIMDRQKLLRNFHEVFVKEKNNGLYLRYNQKYGSVSRQPSVIEYVKQIKKLIFNLDNKVSFEKESEIQSMFNGWRQKQIYHVEQIVVEVKRLKEFNEDCRDLGCEEKKCSDEKGLVYLCEKLSGKLQDLGAETKKKIRDRRAALDGAENEEEKKAIKRIYPNLPEKPEQMYGYISALAPKEEKHGHGKGMMYMSFYNKMKKNFKSKSVASDNEKAWCTNCKMRGHHSKSWKCPKSEKDIPTTHKKEFLNFCSIDHD